jgi:hypothetical protein
MTTASRNRSRSTTMSRSKYVCARCGLAVYPWGKGDRLNPTTYWRHHTGGYRYDPENPTRSATAGKTCGLPPTVVERATFDTSDGRTFLGAYPIGTQFEIDGECCTIERLGTDPNTVMARGEPRPDGDSGTLYIVSTHAFDWR